MIKTFFDKTWRVFVILIVILGLFGQPANMTWVAAAEAEQGTGFTDVNKGLLDSPPSLPASFYGEVHFSDSPPAVGDTLEAYLPGVTGPAATVAIADTDGTLTYAINIPGDLDTTPEKDGGLSGDPITFKINGRVVATGIWQSGVNTLMHLHPPQALPGGPYNGNEGSSINFSGSAVDWLTTDTFTYAWDWDNNGTYDATGPAPSHTWADNGTYTVGLKVTDAQGGQGTTTFQVTVNNVAPTLTISGADTVNEGSVYTLTLSASDPGADTISGWTINWGHGAPQAVTGNPPSVTHTYPDGPASYTITATATDEDGAYSANSKSVTVNNVAPTVTVTNATVTVNEGQTAANSGAYADPGDDTVTLSASVGSVTGANGAWTWSWVTTDGPAQGQTVTITVTDSDSAAGTGTFSLVVNNVAPTATFNAPASVAEGSPINLSLTGPADPSSADVAAGFQYAFDCGAGYGAWSGTSTAACPTTDDGSRTVKGKIKDKDGGETEYTATVTITNIPPVANAGGPYTGTAGAAVALSAAASTCASVDTCTYAWDLDNNGQYNDATGISTSRTWNTIGTYTIGLQVTDDDGSVSTATTTVTINGATHSISLVPGWNLVSFNLRPQDTSIAVVLASIAGKYDLVYAWDASVSTNNWKKYDPNVPYASTLTTLDETRGFWIHMTSAATLNVVGSVPTTTSIALSTAGGGWNLVGYPSQGARPLPDALRDNGVGTNYTLVYSYRASDTTDPWKLFDRNAPGYANDLTQLTPGWGYWVRVTSNSTWTVGYLP